MSEARTEAGELVSQLTLEIFRLNGRLLAAGDELTAPQGQTSARWQVLGALWYGPATVPDIARRMGRARQSVQEVVNRLLSERLVASVAHPTDRRTRLMRLTPVGRTTLRRLTDRQVGWSNRLAEGLPVQRLQVALTTLQEIAQRLADEEAQG